MNDKDIIKRQQAEIERLSKFATEERCREIAQEMIPSFVKQSRAEAIKEFANRLKPMMFNYYECVSESAKGRPYKGDTLMDYEVVDMIDDSIDNLVKEMLEEVEDK